MSLIGAPSPCRFCGREEQLLVPVRITAWRLIRLSKGLYARVSPEDYEEISKHKWYASHESRGTKWYAIRREGGKKIRMHRQIMGLGPDPEKTGPVVDHLDHDSLNNCRWNLEIITQAENMRRSRGWKKKGDKLK